MGRVAAIVAAVVAAWASVGHADVAQDRAAELFDEGQRLIDAGKVDAACAKFAASFAVDPALGTKLNLADCTERQGKLVAALALFQEVELEAGRASPDTVNQARQVLARERIALVQRKLVKVALRVGAPERAGLVIALDSGDERRVISRELWSTPLYAEPGAIVVEASAPGYRTARIEGTGVANTTLALDLPALAPEQAPTEGSANGRLAAYITAGGGAALLVSSIVLGLHAKAKYDHALAELRPNVDEEIDDAQREGNIATALAITGAVAITVGVVLYVRYRGNVTVAPSANDGGVGVVASGRF